MVRLRRRSTPDATSCLRLRPQCTPLPHAGGPGDEPTLAPVVPGRDALALALVLKTAFALPSSASDPGPIRRRTDLTRARTEAGAVGRLVWLQFTGPWCHNCRRMDAEVFDRPRVVGLSSSDFVPVKLRADDHEELALGFELTALPATVILRPTGEVVARTQGFLDVESFQNFLLSALSRAGRRRPRNGRPWGPTAGRS